MSLYRDLKLLENFGILNYTAVIKVGSGVRHSLRPRSSLRLTLVAAKMYFVDSCFGTKLMGGLGRVPRPLLDPMSNSIERTLCPEKISVSHMWIP